MAVGAKKAVDDEGSLETARPKEESETFTERIRSAWRMTSSAERGHARARGPRGKASTRRRAGARPPRARRPTVAAHPTAAARSDTRRMEILYHLAFMSPKRVRTHANPRAYRGPVQAPDWAAVFACPDRPWAVEWGTGKGGFLLAHAESFPDMNIVGIEIRKPSPKTSREIATRGLERL